MQKNNKKIPHTKAIITTITYKYSCPHKIVRVPTESLGGDVGATMK